MITTGSQVIGTTASAIDGIAASPCVIYIRNPDSTKTLYIGNGNVTTANGLPIDKLSTQSYNLPAGEQLHMISSEPDHNISWLRIVQ
jgi:hypothetical protein